MKRVTSLHVRNVPVDAKAHFKSWCAKRGYTMEMAVVALITAAVRSDKSLKSPSR